MMDLKCLIVVAIVAIAGPVQADVITFGDIPLDRLDLAGPQMEGDFVYTATVGEGWELQTVFSVEGAALATFFNGEGSDVGDTVEVEMTGGGLFTFDSVDFSTILDSESDDVLFSGFLGGDLVDTLLLDFSNPGSFVTVLSGFTGPIDLLTLEVVGGVGSNAAIFDNLVVTPVPAPGALATLGLFGLLGGRRRRGV